MTDTKNLRFKTHVHLFQKDEGSHSAEQGYTRFIVTRNTFTNNYCVHEIRPVWSCGDGVPSDDMFVTSKSLEKIKEYHQDIEVHEPIFSPFWISEPIDFYEDYFISYDVYEDVVEAWRAIFDYEEKIENG